MSDFRLPKTPSALRDLLESRGLRLTKKRGQNFLVDTNVLEGIASDAAVEKGALVLEIGPGAGALTEYLVQDAGLVVAVDIDRGMIALLHEALEDTPNLLLCEADVMGKHNALNADLDAMMQAILSGQELAEDYAHLTLSGSANVPAAGFDSIQVVANLPYSITSPVIIALLESSLPIDSLTLLVQREVAEKISADVGDSDWGLLSLLVQLHGDAEILRKVGKKVFWPAPTVDSALIRITPKAGRDRAALERLKSVVAPVFRYRRKSLNAGLKHGHDLKGADSQAIINAAGLSITDHVEKLTIEQLEELSEAFFAHQSEDAK